MLPSQIEKAFEIAKNEFFKDLKRPNEYDFSKLTTIDDVYDATEKLQSEQEQTGNMRHLKRIKPYLDALQQYVGVLDSFSQIKAEFITLIWAPIKLLIQISSTLAKSYDKIVDAMGQIGDRLPHFKMYGELFHSNDRFGILLSIFFRDILDFHVTAMNFFKMKKWDLFFESLWPKCGNRIMIILANIERHTSLMHSEVTISNIVDAQEMRKEAMNKYKRDEEFQRRQDFDTCKQAILPTLYDEELDRFRRDRCPQSGEWLDSEKHFCQWLDPKVNAGRLLWLKGIPGAGKTILSSRVIEKAREIPDSNTIFAFLSYQTWETAPVKILHSLIFQLLLDNSFLQPIMTNEVQSQFRKVSADTLYVQALLVKLLSAVGLTYIVVDGLDEIKERDRQCLLKILLETNRDCAEMRLLISCRAEDDITRSLSKKANCIQVDRQNIQDIREYILLRINPWLDLAGFNREIATEIKRLLEPLPSKAKGMILFAKLVMDNLFLLSTLNDIREELCSLPDGLNQAYGRILGRINEQLSEKERNLARRVLGWIGNTKIPMRKRELEDAISVQREGRNFVKSHRVFLNITRLCGPIVDVLDDYVQFVHFSAKEYLHGPQSGDFIRSTEAHLDICTTCLSYLSFDCFDEPDPDDIETFIFRGDYVFLEYAATQVLYQIKKCAQLLSDPADIDDLCHAIENFTTMWGNPSYDGARTARRSSIVEFVAFQRQWPHLCEILALEDTFWRFKAPLISMNNCEELCNGPPLSVFNTYGQIQSQIDLNLCQNEVHIRGCRCQELRNHYGLLLFKCDRLTCTFRRRGFVSSQERDLHIRAHDRPFKCSDPACQFAEIGFRSEAELNRHIAQVHQALPLAQMRALSSQDINFDDLEALLVDAVKAGEIDYIRHFMGQISDAISDKLYQTAVATSTPAMVEQFIKSGKDINRIEQHHEKSSDDIVPLLLAVNNNNVKVVKYLLECGCDCSLRDKSGGTWQNAVDRAMCMSDPEVSVEVLSLLLDHGVDIKARFKSLCALISRQSSLKDDFGTIKQLEFFKPYTKKGDDFNDVLKMVAQRNCSIEIGNYLIRNGADVNTRGSNNINSMHSGTPLYMAAKRSNAQAAEFMKFLLESGANPFILVGGRKAGEMPGARNISTWLNMTWNELVESTAVKLP